MSQENVEIVRTPVALGNRGRRRRRRTLGERFAIRFPGVVARITARLPGDPRSRLRRAVIVHGTRLGFEATNRGDFDLLLARYSPEAETHHHPHTHELAYEPTLRGREGVLRFFEEWLEEWEEVGYDIRHFSDYETAKAGLKWFRYAVAPIGALCILLMVQAKSSRGLKFALGESEVQVEVTT